MHNRHFIRVLKKVQVKNGISLFVFFIFKFSLCISQNQGLSNLWYMGYSSWAGPPTGGINIDFYTGVPVINYVSRPMDFNRTNANITDTMGNILFYTNGYYIADATDDTMQNGSNISPTSYYSVFPEGLVVPQACLILPKPGSSNLFYIFHSTLDNAPYYTKAHYLYYSIIDMNLNSGKGAVTTKNFVLISDTLNAGKITACKHANGRDLWVVCHRFNSNNYYKFLLTPNGISSPVLQAIGSVRNIVDIGQAVFSPNGSKFTYFNAYYTTTGTLDIYDFDRCSGDFSNPSVIIIPQCTGLGGGLAFSASSQYLYVSNIDTLYQFDVTVSNISASQITVAAWDSFYSPNPPFATLFDLTQLAPDGKIYIGTGNSTFRMHIINYPDSLGLSCDVQQHSLILPAFYAGGIPNHPNYFLGCDTMLGCTCLTTGISHTSQFPEGGVKASPNPSNGVFTLQFPVQKTPGLLVVYDVFGNRVHNEYVAQWSQYKHVDIAALPRGIYLCKMKWGDKEASVKVIKE